MKLDLEFKNYKLYCQITKKKWLSFDTQVIYYSPDLSGKFNRDWIKNYVMNNFDQLYVGIYFLQSKDRVYHSRAGTIVTNPSHFFIILVFFFLRAFVGLAQSKVWLE